MAKTLKYTSPYQDKALFPEVGLVFHRDVPKVVTDEQAAILLARHEYPFVEGDNAMVTEHAKKYPNFVPHPNPLVGQQKHPHLELCDDAAPAPVERPAFTPTPVVAPDVKAA